MSEKIWFFARGDTEHGPVTAKHIKALAESGKLRGDDLVWREGMADWTLAGEVSEIFEGDSPALIDSTDLPDSTQATNSSDERLPKKSDGSPTLPELAGRPALSRKKNLLPVRDLGIGCVIGGVMLAFLAKGCDISHAQYAANLRTRTAYASATFENAWAAKRKQLEQRQQTLADQVAQDENPLNRQQLQQVEAELASWENDKSAAQGELETGEWARSRQLAGDATVTYQTFSFYRFLVFFVGSFVLLAGLSLVSLRGVGPERWICLGLLAFAIYSLFIGGSPWPNLPTVPVDY